MVYCEGHRPVRTEGSWGRGGGGGEWAGGGGDEGILHFSTVLDDLMDDVTVDLVLRTSTI